MAYDQYHVKLFYSVLYLIYNKVKSVNYEN